MLVVSGNFVSAWRHLPEPWRHPALSDLIHYLHFHRNSILNCSCQLGIISNVAVYSCMNANVVERERTASLNGVKHTRKHRDRRTDQLSLCFRRTNVEYTKFKTFTRYDHNHKIWTVCVHFRLPVHTSVTCTGHLAMSQYSVIPLSKGFVSDCAFERYLVRICTRPVSRWGVGRFLQNRNNSSFMNHDVTESYSACITTTTTPPPSSSVRLL